MSLVARNVFFVLAFTSLPFRAALAVFPHLPALPGFERIYRFNDDASKLFPGLVLERNIERLEELSPRKVDLDLPWRPWADLRWPPRAGMIAARTRDSDFSFSSVEKGYRYIREKSLESIARSGVASEIEKLSATEKYDLLTGDVSATLTEAMWTESKRIIKEEGNESWLGLCEGSAGAALSYPEPMRAVSVKSRFKDLPVVFYPNDIKGLASFLWSTYVANIPIVGGRCEESNGLFDSGFDSSEDCQDNNPATWHLAAVNLLGLKKGRLVIDDSPDLAVWNVPVLGYEMRYFHPQTERRVKTLSEATAPVEQLEPSRKRAPNARYVVGVHMKVFAGRRPLSGLNTGANPLKTMTHEYSYTLELDSNKNIIGGEWEGDAHPDFIWAISPKFRPQSFADKELRVKSWDGHQVPEAWLPKIKLSSLKLQPMESIVRRLVEVSAAPSPKSANGR